LLSWQIEHTTGTIRLCLPIAGAADRPTKQTGGQKTDRRLRRVKIYARFYITLLAISAKITAAATTTGVFMTAAAAARRFVAEEAVLPSFRRPSFIDRQRAIIKRESIESANGAIGLFLRLHRNKAESTRFTGEFILDDFDV
jgi:hypothetical protein